MAHAGGQVEDDRADPSQQLAALPAPIQEQLWRLVRAGAGLSQEERTDSLAALVGVAEAFLALRPDVAAVHVAVLDAVGQVLTEIDRATYPRSKETTS